MSNYVPSTEQLVSAIVCRDVQRSAAFYRQLGFEMVRDDGDFAIVAWEGHQLFLGELASFHNHEVEHVELPTDDLSGASSCMVCLSMCATLTGAWRRPAVFAQSAVGAWQSPAHRKAPANRRSPPP